MKDKNHLLHDFLPKPKKHSYNLRKASHTKPKLNTERFKNSFVNRLNFKYDLSRKYIYFNIIVTGFVPRL